MEYEQMLEGVFGDHLDGLRDVKFTNANQVSIAVARFFGVRKYIVVPNVSWGLGVHECDLLLVAPSAFATEVEIKVSKADLKKDLEKRHSHNSDKIRRLFFAIPERLLEFSDLIPERAGILVVRDARVNSSIHRNLVRLERGPQINKSARRLTPAEVLKVAHLGTMRIFDLKEKIEFMKLAQQRERSGK